MPFDKNNRPRLKSYFVKNAIPTEEQFANLIDGMLIQGDDSIIKPANNPLSIEASGDPSSQKKTIHFYDSFSDAEPAWVLSLNPRSVADQANTAQRGFSIGDSAGTSRLFIHQGSGKVGVGTISPGARLTVTDSDNHLQLGREKATEGGKVLFLELVQHDTNPSTVPEVYPAIRFHHGHRYWHRLEARSDGFHFKDGSLDSDAYRQVFTGGLRVLADSNPVNFTPKWSGTPDNVTNTAEISNDTNTYKTLMIIGNRSAGRTEPGRGRRVSIWDILEVNGDLAVTRNTRINGKLGIGIAPAQELHLYGAGNMDMRIQSSDGSYIDFGTGKNGHFVYGYGNLPLFFGTNGAERMRLDAAGKLGIGTTAPRGKLDVPGGNVWVGQSLNVSAPASGANAGVINIRNESNNKYWHITHRANEDDKLIFFRNNAASSGPWQAVLKLTMDGHVEAPGGALVNGIGLATQIHGKTKYPHETIQLNPGHNLRIWYGTTERFYFGRSGNFVIRFDKGYWSFQTDGNLVKYNSSGKALWALNKVSGHAGW